jgi:hypothetical protein
MCYPCNGCNTSPRYLARHIDRNAVKCDKYEICCWIKQSPHAHTGELSAIHAQVYVGALILSDRLTDITWITNNLICV